MLLADKKDGLTSEQEEWAREALRTGKPRRYIVHRLVEQGVNKSTAMRMSRTLRDQEKTRS